MNKRYLAVITARAGSKGIPRKNVKMVNQKPLIMYTIEAAEKAIEEGILDKCILSTDSQDIMEMAKGTLIDVPFLRPESLSTDKSKSVDVIFHALNFLQAQGECYDAVITLQPTSPLRSVQNIIDAISLYDASENDSLISVYEEPKANGYSYYRLINNKGVPFMKEHNIGIRRQDMQPAFVRNGAIYISSTKLVFDRKLIIGDSPLLYVMEKEVSIDIDSLEDLEYVEWKLQKQNKFE